MAAWQKNSKKALWMLKWASRRLVSSIEIFLVLIFLVFEEVLWNAVGAPIYRYFRSFRLLKRLEIYIEKEMNRWLLLGIFSIPFIIMEVMAITAGKMFVTGHFFLGVVFYILKGLSTIPVVTIFSMGKEKLLTFKLIQLFYTLILWLQNTAIYLRVKKRINEVKAYLSPKVAKVKKIFAGKRFGLSHRLQKYYLFLRRKLR